MDRRNLSFLALLLTLAICLTIPANAQDEDAAENPSITFPPGITMKMIEAGDTLFHGKGLCFSCHGSTAEGILGPDLTDSNWLVAKGSYLSILRVVLNGISEEASSVGMEMPARGGAALDNDDVVSVAAYVWSLGNPTRVPNDMPLGISNEMIDRGRDVFYDRGDCSMCHGADATGDTGPNLTDDAWIQAKGSYLQVMSTIINGVPAERTFLGVPMPPRGGSRLTDDEVEEVAAFVWYISQSGTEIRR